MAAHKALLARILANLGHPVPSEDELNDALKKAFYEVKKTDGVDPDQVKYKLSLVPIDRQWVKDTF